MAGPFHSQIGVDTSSTDRNHPRRRGRTAAPSAQRLGSVSSRAGRSAGNAGPYIPLCRDHLGDQATHQALHLRGERQEDGEVLTAGILEIAVGVEPLDLRAAAGKRPDEAPALLLGHAEDPFRLLDQLGGDLLRGMQMRGHAELLKSACEASESGRPGRAVKAGTHGPQGEIIVPLK